MFTLYWLWRDTKQRKDISLTLWLPTLWLMRCGSRTIDYWLGGDASGRLDPTAIAILIAVGIVVLARRRCSWAGIIHHNFALFIFYAYLILSEAWVSEVSNPLIKIFRPVGDVLMALLVATEPDPREAIRVIFRRCVILLIPMSVVLIRYFTELGCVHAKHGGNDIWAGVTTHKNPLGQLCIISALIFIWEIVEAKKAGKSIFRQYFAWFYLFLTVYLFNGGGNADSRSSTSFICLILALGIYFALGRFKERPEMVVRYIFISIVALVAISLTLEFFGTSLQGLVAWTQGKDATLSDRTYIWQDVIRIGMKNPILGTGYGGFWVPSVYDELSPQVDNHPEEAHNGYLETWANLGFIGVGLLVWVILQSLRSATRLMREDFEYGRLRLALLFMALVMNYSEATFTVGNHLWWFGFLLVAVYARPWVLWPEKVPAEVPDGTIPVQHKEEALPA